MVKVNIVFHLRGGMVKHVLTPNRLTLNKVSIKALAKNPEVAKFH